MKGKLLAAVGSLALVVLPHPVSAATVSIEARHEGFRPAGIGAFIGDDVTWNITSGMHDIETYAGPASFDSGARGAPGSFTWTNTTGGVVKYRCSLHSTLSAGVCNGMCGVLSDAPPTVTPPTITMPTNGANIASPGTTVAGSAPGAETVRIVENGGIIGIADVAGSSFSKGINFAAGSHTIRAISIDANGFESAPSSAVTFTITAPDTTPPFVQFADPGDLSIQMSLTNLRVLVTDNLEIANVIISARRIPFAIPDEIAWECESCTDTRWLVSGSAALGTGLIEVTATGIDAAGNRASDTIYVLSAR